MHGLLREPMGIVEPNGSISPDRTMIMVLQCRAQSSQVEVLHNYTTAAISVTPLPTIWKTAGGVLTNSSSATVSFIKNVIKEASAQVVGADGAPSFVEAA